MKHVSTALLGLCLLLVSIGPINSPLSAQTQNVATGTGSTPEALAMLRSIRDRYAEYSTMKMAFTLEIKDLESDEAESKKGVLSVGGDRFRLVLDEQTLVCDGKTAWTYLADVNEVQINDWDPDQQDFMSPSELFQLPEDEYRVFQEDDHKGPNGQRYAVLSLSPVDRELEFHTIQLVINPQTSELQEAIIMDRNAIHFIYRIEAFEGDPTLPTDHFQFKPEAYDNISVIDLR